MLNNIKIILKNKWFYLLVLLTLAIPSLYEKLPIRIDITQQQSLSNTLWISYSDLNIDTDYILFIPPKSRYIKDEKVQYLKMIACKEGDLLESFDSNFYCNKNFIGTARKYDSNMNIVEQFKFNGIFKIDKYFFAVTHELCYDSKYFGFIDKSQILRKETPLFKD